VGENMSLAEAENKLKEFFYYVSAFTATWLSSAYNALARFYEGTEARIELMTNISVAIYSSLEDACIEGVLGCSSALEMYGEIMFNYGFYFSKIVDDGDISTFIKFLDEVIRILSRYIAYVAWAKRTWKDAKELIETISRV
jgi:hypothetical protein